MVAELFNRHREQRDRDLLACREKHILLSARGVGVNFLLLFNENIGKITLSRNNNYNVVALGVGVCDDFRDVHYALGVTDRCSAEFLNY